MDDTSQLIGAIAEAMDTLDIAVCAFDLDDCALRWNRTFVKYFPEHDGHVRAGEPYRDNLRRFYEARLSEAELPLIERYIEEGVARHRAQQRPFIFEHRGSRLKVASLPLPGAGRIRIWKRVQDGDATATPTLRAAGHRSCEWLIEDGGLFGNLADGLMVASPEGSIAWANEAFVAMYGLQDRNAARGRRFEAIYRSAWERAGDAQDAAHQAGHSVLTENLRFIGAPFEVPLPHGRWTRITHQCSADSTSFSTHVDITVLKQQQQDLVRAEQRAKESNALLEATLERMQQGVMMVNSDRIVEVCNRSAIGLLGLPEALMASKPSFEEVLAYQWSTNEFRYSSDSLHAFVRAGGITDQPQSYERKRPDGRVIEVQSVPISGGGVLRTYTDISERKRNEERIRHMARHDGLTSLVNREVFLESLMEAFSGQTGKGPGFAVHYIDLDRFKPINDRHGHAIGNLVLTEVAQRMRRIARDKDVVARMGGDEFAVLQRDVSHMDEAFGLAHRILEDFARPLEVEAIRLRVGASVGIAFHPGSAENVDTLLRQADSAMYAAKSSSCDSVRAFADGMALAQGR